MAYRRETKHFVTASLRGPEDQARLAGRRSASARVGVEPTPEASWGSRWGAGVEVREGVSGEQSCDPGGLPVFSHTCLQFSPGPLSQCCPLPDLHSSLDGVIHLLIHSTNIY